ncbi:SDR family NAD(P)-dependent oxidoreductase [Paracoccus actinidiae]|uniref:SDR family NAD(P)-dependent oxidoreductase n=1 Tax=Paracoccus actinidiae TaxID=3064531 RepID=UPI0027D2A661|nr:SDR family NAD(P)-dependent oxidoreductase [Paracoccus sp. M09]
MPHRNVMNASRFAERPVLVFGAGGSMDGWSNGKAAAFAYAREGARVACIDRDPQAAANTVEAIHAEGGEAEAIVADVTDSASVKEAVARAVAAFGLPAVLHNNVGVTHFGGPVELEEEAFDASVALNLGSVYRTCKAVIPHFLAQRGGVIVNISSIAAIRWTGYPYFAYSATKAAVNQATVALALQYARHGIRANCIMPGAIDTPLIYRQIAGQYSSVEEMQAARARMVPMGRMGTAWDIAEAALFLASDQAAFITGAAIPVDGGQTCAMQPLSDIPGSATQDQPPSAGLPTYMENQP